MITEITISLRYTCVTNIQGISSKTTSRYNNNTYTLSHIFLWNTHIIVKIHTHSITHSENTTFITVNDVTMQKASLLKISLNVSFLSNLLSFNSRHLFQTQIWEFKHRFNVLSIFDGSITGVWRRVDAMKFVFDIATHVTHEANWK